MTPAERPSEKERNRVLVFFAKKAIALPMPVAHPANRLSNKAYRIGDMAMCVLWVRHLAG